MDDRSYDRGMVDSANSRYGVSAAPGGLDIVQELLNTSSAGLRNPTPDLLGDATAARQWSDDCLAARGYPTTSAEVDADVLVEDLRALRASIRAAIVGDGDSIVPQSQTVTMTLDDSGTVVAEPESGITGHVLVEIMRAQARGDWSRLKVCALEQCGVAFHDRSKNQSARYHAARCANHVNLKNSRARRA